jgi:hypothetical protein
MLPTTESSGNQIRDEALALLLPPKENADLEREGSAPVTATGLEDS